MNIFVAGVHGVGKTYLASRLPATLGLTHTPASKLINEERVIPNWGADGRTSDVKANQILLSAAVQHQNNAGNRLLLDGHFVLLGAEGELTRLGTELFESLNLDGVVLLEADPNIIALRVLERDSVEVDIDHIMEFMAAERAQAQLVCNKIGIPLLILEAPNLDSFTRAITSITLD